MAPKPDLTIPNPCQLALVNPDIQKFIARHCCGERGIFMCVMVSHLDDKGAECLSIAEMEFVTCKRAEDKQECPKSVKALFQSLPAVRNHIRSYSVKHEFLLGAALQLANGEFGCQAGKFPAPRLPAADEGAVEAAADEAATIDSSLL